MRRVLALLLGVATLVGPLVCCCTVAGAAPVAKNLAKACCRHTPKEKPAEPCDDCPANRLKVALHSAAKAEPPALFTPPLFAAIYDFGVTPGPTPVVLDAAPTPAAAPTPRDYLTSLNRLLC